MLSRDELHDLFEGLAGLPYGGEAVDQRTHALQAAAHAVAAGADDELVLAAAFHDVGRARQVAERHRGVPHEQAGAAFARDHLTERSAWAIEQHVAAKRYLVTVDPAYHDALSPVSVRSLRVQGGPMTSEEAIAFESCEWSADAVALRRWDDDAKDPEGPVLAMADLVAAYQRVMAHVTPR